MHACRPRSESRDKPGRIGRRAFLVLGTFVLALAWAAPRAGVEATGANHSERERQTTSLEESLQGHRPVARSCEKPRGFRRITMKGGAEFAREGEVFAFDKREIRLGKCEEVEVTLENTDDVRHALMLPSLNPMFILEFRGKGVQTARFITPDEDITLEFHCHVPLHEEMGMEGVFVVGKGGEPKEERVAAVGRVFEGVGKVILADSRKGQIVVDHQEIPGFMAAMIMGYPVKPARLLRGLEAGDRIRFAIDANQQAIVKISPLTFKGEGTVISVDRRKGQIVIDHKEIPGFMAAMIMGYPVKSPKLLMDLTAGVQIGFTIDAEQRAIVEITP